MYVEGLFESQIDTLLCLRVTYSHLIHFSTWSHVIYCMAQSFDGENFDE